MISAFGVAMLGMDNVCRFVLEIELKKATEGASGANMASCLTFLASISNLTIMARPMPWRQFCFRTARPRPNTCWNTNGHFF